MRWLGLVMALLLGGACSSATEGSTAPRGHSAEATTLALPPRPRDLRIDGLDPCSLLTNQQRVELGLEQQASTFVDDSALYGGRVPSCLLRGRSPRAVSVGIGVVTTVGVDQLMTRGLAADLDAATVNGFPAVVTAPRAAHDYCNVEIDIAQGQLVDVLYGDIALAPAIAQDDLCREGVRVAEAVVMTLSIR